MYNRDIDYCLVCVCVTDYFSMLGFFVWWASVSVEAEFVDGFCGSLQAWFHEFGVYESANMSLVIHVTYTCVFFMYVSACLYVSAVRVRLNWYKNITLGLFVELSQ